jgi:GntR family transcriptional regulator
LPRHQNFREIADDLEERIEIGEYARGSRLPTYEELAALYGVSRSTAQRAIALLQDRRVVRGHQGRGNFVEGGAAS